MKKMLKRTILFLICSMLLCSVTTSALSAYAYDNYDDYDFIFGHDESFSYEEEETTQDIPVCEHSYIVTDVTAGIITLECELCDDIQTGTIPEYVGIYEVTEFYDNGLSYSYYIDSSFKTGDTKNLYISPGYATFCDIEFIVSDTNILQIDEIFETHDDCYSFTFKKEGVVTVKVVSKYDNNTIYGTLIFISEDYPTYIKSYYSLSAETDTAGDVDGNGKLNSADARCILRLSASLSSCGAVTMQYADTNGDYKITSSDARVVLRISAKLDDESLLAQFNLIDTSDTYGYYYYENTAEKSLVVGDTESLDYFIVRGGSNLTWRSTNTKAVTVDKNGKIKAVGKGYSCVIVSNGTETYYYDITVKNELQKKIDNLRNKYPDGYYWNNYTPSVQYPNVTETPCTDHDTKTYAYCKGQCAGFAALMFNEVHGNNVKISYGVTWDTVQIGDYLRLLPHHSVFVTDVVKEGDIIGYDRYSGENITASSTYIVVVHCNWGRCCNIAWDDYFSSSTSIESSLSYTAK